jgi:hypothetical protein
MQQVTGGAVASIVALAYVLVVQAMTAAILLLGQFVVLQVRALRNLAVVEPKDAPTPAPVSVVEPEQGPPYRLGGDLKWQ